MRVVRPALIGLAALAYALVFGELFLRVLAPQPLVPRFVTGAPDGIRANIPNVAFRQWTPEVDVTVRYNDAGMRDDRPAPPRAKPPGECRIALLGDSYFVGFESDYPHSFAKRLEDDLRAAGANARVLDFAVSGFGTAEMLATIDSRVRPWAADVVVMSWHASDPNDNVRSQLYRLDGDRLVATGQPFLPGVEISDRLMRMPGYRWLIENSHLYSAVRERIGTATKTLLAQIRGQQVAVDDANALLPPPEPLPDPIDIFIPDRPPNFGNAHLDRALVVASHNAAARIGAQFLLFEVPTAGGRTRLTASLPYLGPLPGIATASPIDAFRAVASPSVKLYYERGHHHWTDLGNAIAAREAARALLAQGWLGGCRAASRPAP